MTKNENLEVIITELSSKIDEIHLNLNPNMDDTKIKKYIQDFGSIKTDIQKLLNSRSPISFIFQLKKIKDTFFMHIENLIDYIEKEFSLFNTSQTEKHKLLYDLGFEKIIVDTDYVKYLENSKYFFEDIYFEAYSLNDGDFLHFVQKIISLKNVEKIAYLKNEEKYSKYSNFIDFIIKNNIDFSNLTLEKKFGYYIVKNILESSILNKKELLNEFYSYFPLGNIQNSKYSKLVKLNSKMNYELNDFKKSQISYELTSFLDEILQKTTAFNFDFYIQVYNFIKTQEDGQIRGYLWGYLRDKITKNFTITNWNDFTRFSQEKFSENFWLENRLNYRINLRNDTTKQETYALMDGFNQFRNIILNIQDSYFGDFYKIYILEILSDKLALNRDTYTTFKFFMLFVLPKNYLEYCKIYTFFLEYDKYKDNRIGAILKLGILSILGGFIITNILFFKISWILGLGVILFVLGEFLKEHNFRFIPPIIRFHLGFSALGISIILFYSGVFLANNGFFELKMEKLNIITKNTIVWQKLDETTFYKNTGSYLSSILNFKK